MRDVSQVLEIALESPEEETVSDFPDTGSDEPAVKKRSVKKQRTGKPGAQTGTRPGIRHRQKSRHRTGRAGVKILALSTAESGCSLAVMDNDQLVCESFWHSRLTHSRRCCPWQAPCFRGRPDLRFLKWMQWWRPEGREALPGSASASAQHWGWPPPCAGQRGGVYPGWNRFPIFSGGCAGVCHDGCKAGSGLLCRILV